MPLVSVIIPTYNEEQYVEDCLKSLKEQIFKNFEVILVDDGSTDNTVKTATKYKIRIIKQNHKGPGTARNRGAREARGKILVLIDADMYFDRDYIKNLILPIINDKEIIGTTHDYEIATNLSSPWSRLWGKVRVSKDKAWQVKIFRAIKKDKFLEMGGFDQKYGYADDQTFWYKHGIKPTVAKNTTCYHKNPSSLKATYKQARWIGKSWKERFKIFRIPIINYLSTLGLYVIYIPIVLIKSIKPNAKTTITERLQYYFVKFLGFINGNFESVFLGRVWK